MAALCAADVTREPQADAGSDMHLLEPGQRVYVSSAAAVKPVLIHSSS